MARQRPVRVRPISRRHVVEHRRQNRKFGVRFPGREGLCGLLRAREGDGVAEDEEQQGQGDELPAVGPDVVDL
jgi:hypothetical protein